MADHAHNWESNDRAWPPTFLEPRHSILCYSITVQVRSAQSAGTWR